MRIEFSSNSSNNLPSAKSLKRWLRRMELVERLKSGKPVQRNPARVREVQKVFGRHNKPVAARALVSSEIPHLKPADSSGYEAPIIIVYTIYIVYTVSVPQQEPCMATRKIVPTAKTTKPTPTRRVAAKRLTVAPTKPALKAKPVVAGTGVEAAKVKHKLVRDSFTIPKGEYAVLDDLKQRATRLTRPTKKGELLRAGIVALSSMSDTAFLAALGKVPSLKTGRPKELIQPTAKPAAKK